MGSKVFSVDWEAGREVAIGLDGLVYCGSDYPSDEAAIVWNGEVDRQKLLAFFRRRIDENMQSKGVESYTVRISQHKKDFRRSDITEFTATVHWD